MTGILLGATVPLGSLWVSGAKLTKVEGALTQAVGKAKNSAIRNKYFAESGQPVSIICLTETELSVIEKNNSDTPSCGTTPVGEELWRAELLTQVAIKSQDNVVSCACFDSSGLLTTAGTCSSCLSVNPVVLEVGSKNESLYIY